MVTLRAITANDNAGVKELIQSSLKKRGLDLPGTAYYDPYLADLYHFYQQQPQGNYWVLVAEEKIVGGVGIGPLDLAGVCELQKLYVAEDFQGQGLSKKLMEQALAFAEENYHSCYLETHSSLTEATQLYEAYGFEALLAPLIKTEHSLMDRWYLKKLTKS